MKTENIEVVSNEIIENNREFTGVISGTHSRYGFLSLVGQDDLFIKPQEMDRVFSGDTVRVKVYNYGQKNQDVKIEEVINSKKKYFIGLFSEDESGAYLIPDDLCVNNKIRIPKFFKNKARNNQYIKVELIEHPFKSRKAKAKVIEIIGDKNCWNIQADYNLAKYQIDSYAGEDVVNYCNELVEKKKDVINKLSGKRKDLTKLDFFTIDGENTIDIDDAIYIQKLDNKWKLLVAISDVSEVIEENSFVDNDAYNRVSTVYLMGKTVPMLPFELTDVLSLKPRQKRSVIVADLTINFDGSVNKYSFYEALIESKAKLSYKEVDEFIESDYMCEEHVKIKPSLTLLKELKNVLWTGRYNNNIIPPSREDYRHHLGFNRKIENIERVHQSESYKMIEEAMLCANKCAAEYVSTLPEALYKTQSGLVDNKITSIYEYLKNYIDLERSMLTTNEGYKEVLKLIKEHSLSEKLKDVLSLYLKDSCFSDKVNCHFSMGFDCYTHFTSPIRRYSDILIHRFIKAKINNKKYSVQKENYIKHINFKINNIEKCTQGTEKWMQLDYLDNFDDDHVFKAKIIGLSNNVITIKLIDFGVEAKILIKNLNNKKQKISCSNFKSKFGDSEYCILDEIEVKRLSSSKKDRSFLFVVA